MYSITCKADLFKKSKDNRRATWRNPCLTGHMLLELSLRRVWEVEHVEILQKK